MKYSGLLLTLVFSASLFCDKKDNVLNFLESILRTQVYMKHTDPQKFNGGTEELNQLIAKIGRDNIKLDSNFCWDLLQAIFGRIPQEDQPEMDEREDLLLKFVDTLPNQRPQLHRWLATVPWSWNTRAYPSKDHFCPEELPVLKRRESLLKKIVARAGAEHVFNYVYSEPKDRLPEECAHVSLLQRYAACYCDPEIVSLFLELGADLDFVNFEGKTAAALVDEKLSDPDCVLERESLESIRRLLSLHRRK